MAGQPIQIANGIPQLGVQQIQPQIVYQQQQIQQPLQQQNHQKYKPRERFPGEDKCKLFIGGLDYATTNEQLREYFGGFGEIVDSVIMIDKATQKPRGFGFVTYRHLDDVDKLLSSNKPHVILGRNLQVRKYFPKAEFQAQQEKEGGGGRNQNQQDGGNNQGGGGGGGPFKGPMRISPELKIFVGGIAPGTDETDIRNYFAEFGNIIGVQMPKDHLTKNPRGFAFVGFESKDIVSTVTKDRYHQINGKTVEVKGCDEQEAYMKKRQDYRGNNDQQQQRIQSVVPAVQTIQSVVQQPQTQQIYQLPQQIQQIAQPQLPAGYTVIPAGYSYDPATGIIYQAALPQQAGIPGAQGLASAGQLSQIGTSGALQTAGIQYIQAQPQVITSATQPQAVSAYQPIALGQYQQDPSQFGAQRALPVQQGAVQVQQLPPQQDGGYQQQQQDQGHQQQDNNRGNNQRNFHPYGR